MRDMHVDAHLVRIVGVAQTEREECNVRAQREALVEQVVFVTRVLEVLVEDLSISSKALWRSASAALS